MKIVVSSGKYIVAVSGGVDSVVLLDLLSRQPDLELVVAHFDHGIRTDSEADRQFVASLAKKYGLAFLYQEGQLGSSASESKAREARYAFLERSREKTKSFSIITAHHQDDLLETMVLNFLRGTGRQGFSSLQSSSAILRPLLDFSKAELIDYANDQALVWREDITNSNDSYRRNYIRHNIMPKLINADRQQLVEINQKFSKLNSQIDKQLSDLIDLHSFNGALERQWFLSLPHDLSKEVLIMWLKSQGVSGLDRSFIENLSIAAKTHIPTKRFSMGNRRFLKVESQHLALQYQDR
ncbi:MAG TPA: tRNA lysidine(34) synthetase TilS [Candidatus Saccharimonadales bacterium]|jgi:tRNA(Ile)-lysidine synthetase-like protein|nr:tRNA lysidine(34) synthetase TilS [Candidatus Saccharimonadales bacterium]